MDFDAGLGEIPRLVRVCIGKWSRHRVVGRTKTLAGLKEIAGITSIGLLFELVESVRLHQRALVVLSIPWKSFGAWKALGWRL